MSLGKFNRDDTDDFELWEKKEHSDSEENGVEEKTKYQNLKKAVNHLSGSKRQKNVRCEENSSISVIASKKTYFHGDLVTASTNDDGMLGVKKALKKSRLVEAPVEEVKEQELRRKLAYEGVVEEVTEWQPLVEANRKTRTLELPMRDEKAMQVLKDAPTEFQMPCQPRSKLELKVASLLRVAPASDRKPLSVLERKALIAMNLQEAKEMRLQLQRERVQRAYRIAKLRRQGKIKSKKYHRMLKKGKEKAEEKDMTELKEKDPETYNECLMKEERRRVEERMTLRHKKGSKFMKKQLVYGKFNDQGRQAVHDMLQKGKELTNKTKDGGDDDDDDEEEEEDDGDGNDSEAEEMNSENGEDLQGVSGELEDDEDEEKEDKDDDDVDEDDDDDDVDPDWKLDDGVMKDDYDESPLNEVLDRKKTIEDMSELATREKDDDDDDQVSAHGDDDDDDEDQMSRDASDDDVQSGKKDKVVKKKGKGDKVAKDDIRPVDFFKITDETVAKTTSNTQVVTGKKKKENRSLLVEAMEEDDLVADFMKEKKSVEERDQVKDYHHLTFDDMNQWAGPALKPFEKKKNKRNIIKAPRLKRKDEGMNAVILSEVKDNSASKHQMKRLPHRFTNAAKYEETFKKPVGKLWVKDVEYWKKIRPRVVVKMGEVVESVNKGSLISKTAAATNEEKKVEKRKKVKGQKPPGKKIQFPKLGNKKKKSI